MVSGLVAHTGVGLVAVAKAASVTSPAFGDAKSASVATGVGSMPVANAAGDINPVLVVVNSVSAVTKEAAIVSSRCYWVALCQPIFLSMRITFIAAATAFIIVFTRGGDGELWRCGWRSVAG